ncbi:MAG: 3-dehydroquinate synthase [Bacteroidales bacterium]|jgi:3-dehydroquinate synthase|nr:3-dehydroquinate synthase [Bacteroidales bacterium]
MEKIVLKTGSSFSEIYIGANWESVIEMLPGKGVVIVTDTNINRIYGDRFPDFPVFPVKAGEASKTIETVESLAERLIESGTDRSGFILGIGGGVVCDIAGFLASIYMRGIRSAFISTSLLSQVDASTGGKNGVNLRGTKNVLGSFLQPEFVICDQSMLQTLPEDEYSSGLAELIKTALIGNEKLFEMIGHNSDAISKRDTDLMSVLVSMAVRFKASVVEEDEKESGLRRILNFGHTYGHAIEMYKSFRHGYAVASGMDIAAAFSMARGYLEKDEYGRILSVLRFFKLLRKHDIPDDQLEMLLLRDKKKSGDDIYFVFLQGIGKAVAEKVPVREVIDFYVQYKSGN